MTISICDFGQQLPRGECGLIGAIMEQAVDRRITIFTPDDVRNGKITCFTDLCTVLEADPNPLDDIEWMINQLSEIANRYIADRQRGGH